MSKFKVALVSVFFSLSMCFAGYAAETSILVTDQDKLGQSGMLADCNCEYCKEIEEFFAGEQDATKRELSVQVWKASIHPELFVDAVGAVYVGTFPNADSLQFTALTLGMDNGWPRCRVADGNLKVYMPAVSGPGLEAKKACVDKLYKMITEVRTKIDTEGLDTQETLFNWCKDNFEYSDEYIQGYPLAKLGNVMREKKACCTGLSTLYKIACQMCGVSSNFVGNASHMFIETAVNGVPRYIDLTGGKDAGYTWYMFGPEQLEGIHAITRR